MTQPPPPTPPQQAVLFPAETDDYKLAQGPLGWGLVANRTINKGELVFDDSLEFNVSDVRDGDALLLVENDDLPQSYLPLSRDTLLRTHGVPHLLPDASGETAGTISWQLEVPGMFMNHSCDPTTADHLEQEDEEGRATRIIEKDEELTTDYVLQYYDAGPFFETCRCGAGAKCRGQMMGFVALSDTEKERLLPLASEAVQAMHRADTGQGLPVKREQLAFGERQTSEGVTENSVMRLVCPGPSWAEAEVAVEQTATPGHYELVALRDFAAGERVYYFWCTEESWPNELLSGGEAFDLVFSTPYSSENDPPEGTVVRVSCNQKKQKLPFSCWQLLLEHSEEANLTFNDEDEEENWRSTHATRDIRSGEKLTLDYNMNA